MSTQICISSQVCLLNTHHSFPEIEKKSPEAGVQHQRGILKQDAKHDEKVKEHYMWKVPALNLIFSYPQIKRILIFYWQKGFSISYLGETEFYFS